MANLAELWAVCVQAGGAVCELQLGEVLTLNRLQFLEGTEEGETPALYVVLDLAGTLGEAREKAREWKRKRRAKRGQGTELPGFEICPGRTGRAGADAGRTTQEGVGNEGD